MPKEKEVLKVAETMIVDKIYLIRGQKVMLDRDLAEMYGVETFNLNKGGEAEFRAIS